MESRKRNAWRIAKLLLAVVVIVGVGVHFATLLNRPELWDLPFSVPALVVVAVALLYVATLGLWGGFWTRLLARQGQPVGTLRGLRAYYASQVGKYVPGKALTLVLRAAMVRADGVSPGVAIVAGLYETFTAMAAGALIAAVLLPLFATGGQALGWQALALLAVAGVPILPGVFNALVARLSRPFRKADAAPFPRLTALTLAGGLVQSAVGWALLGLSLWLVVYCVQPVGVPDQATLYARCMGYIAFAYVAGFLAFFLPGGLGVREGALQQLLALELAQTMDANSAGALSVIVALFLRAVWTVGEGIVAGLAYVSPIRPAVVKET